MYVKKVELSNGQTIEVRGLKHGEVKALKREFGCGLADVPDGIMDDVLDWVVERVVPDISALDELYQADVLTIYREALLLTYPPPAA